MKKIAIVYWSATGNTEAMAKAIEEGSREEGAKPELFTTAEFTADMVESFDMQHPFFLKRLMFLCPRAAALSALKAYLPWGRKSQSKTLIMTIA